MFASHLQLHCCCKLVEGCVRKSVVNSSRPLRCGLFTSRRSLAETSSTKSDSCDIELAYTTYPQDAESDPSKKPLIFLHGLFGAKGNVHSVAKHLSSDSRKIVTYDARNHGDSGHSDQMDFFCMSDDLNDLIEELQLGQPVVLGHSMGGRTAMVSALTKPDSLSSLIVADTAPHPIRATEINNMKLYLEAMRKAKIPQEKGLAQARKVVQVQLDPVVSDRGILSFLLTNLREFPDDSIRWRLNLDGIANGYSNLITFPDVNGRQFKKSTLFVYGSNSYQYKNLDIGILKQLFPSAEVEVISDAGHFVHADKPLEFVTVVQEFLKTTEKENLG